MKFHPHWAGSVLFVAALICISAVPAWAVDYTITDLGLSGNYSLASDINNYGQVVGGSYTGSYVAGSPVSHAFLYSGGTIADIGASVGNNNTADQINANGQVLVRSGQQIVGGAYFLYNGGAMTSIGSLWGAPYSLTGINNNGQMVGAVQITPQQCTIDGCTPATQHAFIYSGGISIDLGTLGGSNSNAYGINNNNQVVGNATNSGNSTHAFLYSSGVMTDLGTLGGSYSTAVNINDNGQVVGQAYDALGNGYAFFYSGGLMTKIGSLGGSQSYATDINNKGQVVGFSTVAGGEHAFLYSDGNLIDLNSSLPASSGWTLDRAYAINDSGQIVGYGNIGGKTQAFLMTPVPVPAAFWLFGSGSIVLFGFMRPRKVSEKEE
jgi:probable HAF family extracellular repeat protein